MRGGRGMRGLPCGTRGAHGRREAGRRFLTRCLITCWVQDEYLLDVADANRIDMPASCRGE